MASYLAICYLTIVILTHPGVYSLARSDLPQPIYSLKRNYKTRESCLESNCRLKNSAACHTYCRSLPTSSALRRLLETKFSSDGAARVGRGGESWRRSNPCGGPVCARVWPTEKHQHPDDCTTPACILRKWNGYHHTSDMFKHRPKFDRTQEVDNRERRNFQAFVVGDERARTGDAIAAHLANDDSTSLHDAISAPLANDDSTSLHDAMSAPLAKRGYTDIADVCIEFHCSGKLPGTFGYLKCASDNRCVG